MPVLSTSTRSLVLASSLWLAAGAAAAESDEILVAEVVRGLAAEHAGIEVGDALVGWRRSPSPPANPTPAEGVFDSPFQPAEVEQEQRPRGPVVLFGRRGDQRLQWDMPDSPWGLVARPRLPGQAEHTVAALWPPTPDNIQTMLAATEAALRQADAGLPEATTIWLRAQALLLRLLTDPQAPLREPPQDIVASLRRVDAAAAPIQGLWLALALLQADRKLEVGALLAELEKNTVGPSSTPLIQGLLLAALAEMAGQEGQAERAGDLARRALALREANAPGSRALLQSLEQTASALMRTRDVQAALTLYERALGVRATIEPDSPATASTWNMAGLAAEGLADRAKAERYFRKALELRQRLSPDSLDVAWTLSNLARCAVSAGNTEEARDLHQRALAIRERLAPGSGQEADSLDVLAALAEARGDGPAAEALRRRELVVRKAISAESPEVAHTLSALARLAELRGDAASAEDLLRQAVAVLERVAPDSLALATVYENVARLAVARRDLTSATAQLEMALRIREHLPLSLDLAVTLNALGAVAAEKRDLPLAERFHRRALDAAEQVAPESTTVATSLNDLGTIAESKGDLETAERLHSRALALLQRLAPESLRVATSLSNLGNVAAERGALDVAAARHREALRIRERLAPGSRDLAQSLNNLGAVLQSQGDLAADDMYHRALTTLEAIDPASHDVAASLSNLGICAWARGDLATADRLLQRALTIQEKLAPDSLDVAASLNNLGLLAEERGDLAGAEGLFRRALTIRERVGLDTLDVAASLNNLASIADWRGDLKAAEEFHRRALAIKQRLAPGSMAVAGSLGNLGVAAWKRGDLATAEELHRQALALEEKLAPNSLEMAGSLNNLGVVAAGRGDLAAAEAFYRRALALKEAQAPDSLSVAATLHNLGGLAQETLSLEAAELFYRRALAIKERLAPDSLDLASSLSSLGNLAAAKGDPETAEALHRRGLAINERLSPGSPLVASSLANLGDIASSRGDFADAGALYEGALAILEASRPGTLSLARVLNATGHVAARRGNQDGAARNLCRAVDVLEQQLGRLGGTEETRSGFAARYAYLYRECEDALRAVGRSDQSFAVLERYRARALLQLLAERDLVFAEDVPPDLDRERRALGTEYQRALDALGKVSPEKEKERAEALKAKLREVRGRQEEVVAAIRKASPRFAALQYPQPLGLAEVRDALDQGTVLLSYSVGVAQTALYVVHPRPTAGTGLTVVSLPLGEAALRQKVASYRRALAGATGPARGVMPLEDGEPEGSDIGRELYDLLVKPAEGLLESAERILISPDGPLHTLPFAALRRGDGRYLVEWKPLHVVVSATVYAEVKKTRRALSPEAIRVAAFGDPRYPAVSKDQADKLASPEVRSVVRSGVALGPLPNTRAEVQAITGLFPTSSRAYLGEEATEGRAKGVGKEAEVLHFACHGLVDERFPLNSALALTIPESPKEGEDNGLLQAWEIFESVRIDADLVTLSACETALGQEVGGEGLVGLTRAFQYAGARSVLASLWSVGDASTSQLMKGFYGALKAGKTKDEALREAQVGLLRDPRTSDPFHWAAFEVIGDWK